MHPGGANWSPPYRPGRTAAARNETPAKTSRVRKASFSTASKRAARSSSVMNNEAAARTFAASWRKLTKQWNQTLSIDVDPATP